jgi:hypothetical protein
MVVSLYRISLSSDNVLELKAEGYTDVGFALAVLLNEPGVELSSKSDLKPCFDLAELQRRNREVKRSN